MPPVRQRLVHQYTEEALRDALRAIREENCSIREASRRYHVPRGTIQDRLHGRVKEGPRKMGPAGYLTPEEEQTLVEWLCHLARCGFPRKKDDLFDSVQKILNLQNRKTKFINNRPGEKWYKLFLKRHPQIVLREPEGISKARSIVTKEYILKWFSDLKDYLQENNCSDILLDPTRILNGDETSFSLCPKTGKILAPKGFRNVLEVKKGNDKETLTVLMIFSAQGDTMNPMIIYPYIRPPKAVIESMDRTWFLGRSDTGWIKSDTFYEYIANGLEPWLTEKNISRPVLLFVDGHKTHLTKEISEFCDDKKIILYALPPNTTHLLQPADVSVFKPLKSHWKITVRKWLSKPENHNTVVTKTSFAPLLKDCQSDPNLPNSIRNGFRKCGLYPFDPEAVDYTKCVMNYVEDLEETRQNTLSNEAIVVTKGVLQELARTVQDVGPINEVMSLLDRLTPTQTIETIPSRNDENSHDEDLDADEPNEVTEETHENDMINDVTLGYINDIENAEIVFLDDITQPQFGQKAENEANNFNVTETGRREICRPTDGEQNEIIIDYATEDSVDQRIGNKVVANEDFSKTVATEKNELSNEQEADNNSNIILSSRDNETKVLQVASTSRLTETSGIFSEINENTEKMVVIENSIDKPVSTKPFAEHLFWPSASCIGRKSEKNEAKVKEKMPAAISSAAYRKYLQEKENMKLEKLKQNRKRKKCDTAAGSKQTCSKQKSTQGNIKTKQDCANCNEQLDSDAEDDPEKNIGCDNCSAWFHLKCTEYVGLPFEEICNKDFLCFKCS